MLNGAEAHTAADRNPPFPPVHPATVATPQNLQNFKWSEDEVNAKLDRGEAAAGAGRPVFANQSRMPAITFHAVVPPHCAVRRVRPSGSCKSIPHLPMLPPSLVAVMREAFEAIWELHTEDKIPLRTAAFVKALQASCWRCPHAAAAHMLPCPHAAAAGCTARAMRCLLASRAWHFCV